MIAATQTSLPQKVPFVHSRTFDEIVVGEGATEQRYSFDEFRLLPLSRRVHVLLCKPLRFMLDGIEIPRSEALKFHY